VAVAISVTRWPVWRLPLAALLLVLGVDAAGMIVPSFSYAPITASDDLRMALLASLSITYSATTLQWERIRRAIGYARAPDAPSNLLNSWTFAAAVTLPAVPAAMVITVAFAAYWPAGQVLRPLALHKYLYSAASVLLAAAAAGAVGRALGLAAGLPAAAVVFTAVNMATVMPVIALSTGSVKPLRQFRDLQKHAIEAATLGIGGLIAVLLTVGVPLAWLSLPAAIVLQHRAARTALAPQRETPSPMTRKVWLLVAREVVTACTAAAVLQIETVDREAAQAVARIQAGCDAIGSLSRRRLAVLLTDCPGRNAEAIAARIRAIFTERGIEAVIAVAAKPRDGQSLDELLAVSEAELIARDSATRSARADLPDARNRPM
jgi:hypothetical protein